MNVFSKKAKKAIFERLDAKGMSHENIFWTSLFEYVEQSDIEGNPPEQWTETNLVKLKKAALDGLEFHNQILVENIFNERERFSAETRKEWGKLLRGRKTQLLSLLQQFSHHAMKVPQSNRAAYWDGIRAESRRYMNSDTVLGAKLSTDRWQLDHKALQDIRSASLSDRWLTASSQELMRKIDDQIARGRFQNNPTVSPYPSADVSTNQWKGHAEIRPLDTEREENEISIPEASLIAWAQEMAAALERRGIRVSDASKVLLSLWWEKKRNDNLAHISLDDICEKMGQKKRSGRLGGYEPRARDMIRESIEQAARIKVFLRDLPDTLKGGNKKRQMSDVFINILTRISPQNDTLPNPLGLPKQGELWGPEKWDAIIVQPGVITRMALNEYGRQSMLLPKPLFALDDHRFRSAKLLGTKLAEHFRINVKKQSQTHTLRVATLLTYADIDLDPKAETRLKRDLDILASKTIGLIKSYRFENELEGFVVERGGVRVNEKILNKWKEVMVKIDMADDISVEYAKIAAPPPVLLLESQGLAQELKQAREQSGLSVARLSSLLGVSQGTISNIENGKKVRHSTEKKVRQWLNERTAK